MCVYLFWFRPKQKEKAKKEREGTENRTAVEGGDEAPTREEEEQMTEVPKPLELQQQPPELQSPGGTMELPAEGIFEAPGDKGGVEVDNDAQRPAELPGDYEQRSSGLIAASD